MVKEPNKSYIVVKYTSVSSLLLISYKKFLNLVLSKFKLKYFFISIPTVIKKKTFLKSPHVNKKAKENFKYTFYSIKLFIFASFTSFKLLKYNVPKKIYLKCQFKF